MSWQLYPDDPKQAHRLRRLLLAIRTSLMVLFFFLLYCIVGYLPVQAMLVLTVGTLGGGALFFWMIRSGINLRFADPSLTLPMILYPSVIVLYAISQATAERPVLVLVYVAPFLFGVFRLSGAQLLGVAGFFLVSYGCILSRDWTDIFAPDNLAQPIVEWVVPSLVMCWMAVFAGYVGRLHRRLSQNRDDLEQALEQLQHSASRDELTGLYNRRHLLESLAQEKSRCDRGAEPFSVLILDLDHFKDINDRFGHAAGDEVLRRFADEGRSLLRPSDVFGRFGGEEFLLLCPQTPIEGAQALAERIRQATENLEHECLNRERRLTVSIGATEYRVPEKLEAVLLRADSALYAAKDAGRNQVQTALPAPQAPLAA